MKNWNRLERGFFHAFLFWSVAGLIFTTFRISAATVAHWEIPGPFDEFIDWCIRTGDPILILLAFANTHLCASRQWTPRTARIWGALILICAFAVETLGAMTGFPFGSYHYTDRFGPLLGVVPLTIPLAWHVVVTNALLAVRAVGPYLPRLGETALAALACTVYDFALEPFATTVKHYWNWSGNAIPWQNYAAWFVISGLLVWFLAPTTATRFRLDPRPWLILGLTLLIFMAGIAAFPGLKR